MVLELSISGELSSNLSQAAVRGAGEEGAKDEEEAVVGLNLIQQGDKNAGAGLSQRNPEELLVADGEKTAACAKVVLSEGPFSESETDRSEKDKDCGETTVSSGENKSEAERGGENETPALAGDLGAEIYQVRKRTSV